MRVATAWLVGVLLVLSLSARAQDVPEEARRYMVRGRTAIEMAKTVDDMRFAVKELEQAARLAPQWADPHFNLGVVKEKLGDKEGAIASFKRYLELAPEATDAAKVRDKIIALEYMQERTAQAVALSGIWSGFTVNVEGDRFTAVGSARPGPVQVIFHGGLLVGDTPQASKLPDAVHRFEGQIAGAIIKGVVTREAFIEGRSGCEIPKERSEFTGKVNDEGTRISLKFPRTIYRAEWSGVFWGLENCTGVSAKETEQAEFVLAPALPTGGVGLELRFDTADAVPEVIRVMPGGPASQMGMRSGDRILAVDGQASRGLRSVDVIKRLRGEPGTAVVVRIERNGSGAPEDLTLTRADLTAMAVTQKADAGAVGAKKGVSATSSGCFIATAAYGSPLEAHVATLREFRDRHLLTNAPGRWFVEQYYAHSPPIAAYIREREGLRTVVRALLTPVVHAIRHPLWALLAVCTLAVGIAYLGRRRKRQWRAGAVLGK
jgi:hypothetical protein